MSSSIELITKDLAHIWHPCSQMKDYETFLPLVIKGAKGSYLELADGQKMIDAISSWWCKPLGHGHPRLRQALIAQAQQFEHVILANTTNEVIVELSAKLASLTNSLAKVLYASDGSSAVEIALKMSLHSRQITGQQQRKSFMALENSYHGETCLALSVTDNDLYKQPYQTVLTECLFLKNIPYVNSKADPLWHDCSERWPALQAQLEQHQAQLTAIIVEPIVQGAAGMRIYSADFLRRLRQWTQAHGIHLIADEIMTGFGRTGLPLACQHARIEPDFLCLGKALTGGWLPLSAVLTNNNMYDLFYTDYAHGQSFLHSHTFSGNVLAARVALEFLTVFAEQDICHTVTENEAYMAELMRSIAHQTGKITNIRHLGAITAADLITTDKNQRLGYEVYQQAVKLGALLRPLGNTIYWLPPLNTTKATLVELAAITQQALLKLGSEWTPAMPI